MIRREAGIDDVPVEEKDRRVFGPRPEAERGQASSAAWTFCAAVARLKGGRGGRAVTVVSFRGGRRR